MAGNKTQEKILEMLRQTPFEFETEWIVPQQIPQYCIKGHQMFWAARELQNVGQIKMKEIFRRPGRKSVTKYLVTGPTEIITYKVEL